MMIDNNTCSFIVFWGLIFGEHTKNIIKNCRSISIKYEGNNQHIGVLAVLAIMGTMFVTMSSADIHPDKFSHTY